MKQMTLSNTKLRELQWELKIPLYQVVGLLQTLWMLTAEECPQGDIGKFTNEKIGRMIQWKKPPDELIKLLVHLEWLDEHPQYRLVVHAWPSHCETWIHLKLARAGLLFADGTHPRVSRLAKKEREKLPTKPVSVRAILESNKLIEPIKEEDVISSACRILGDHGRTWISSIVQLQVMKDGALAEIYDEIVRIQGAVDGTRQDVSKPKNPERLLVVSIVNILKARGCKKWPKYAEQ